MRLKLCAAALAMALALGACAEDDKRNQLSTDPAYDDAEVNAALGGVPPESLSANDAEAANAVTNDQ